MEREHPRSTLFPYTTLFRSATSTIATASMPPSDATSATTSNVRRRSATWSCSAAWSGGAGAFGTTHLGPPPRGRSEEHTSELQSQFHLVCRLLLEKKKVGLSSNRAHYTAWFSLGSLPADYRSPRRFHPQPPSRQTGAIPPNITQHRL